jgi:hypothetical protein
VLTEQVPGCYHDLELCDFNTLKTIIERLATRSGDCSAEDGGDDNARVFVQAKTLMTTGKGILMFLGLVVLGAVIGAIFAYVVLTGKVFGKRVLYKEVVEDTSARMGLQDQRAVSGSFEEEIYGFEDEPIARNGSS